MGRKQKLAPDGYDPRAKRHPGELNYWKHEHDDQDKLRAWVLGAQDFERSGGTMKPRRVRRPRSAGQSENAARGSGASDHKGKAEFPDGSQHSSN